MHRTQYTHEVGIDSGDRVVPLPYVFVLLAVFVAGAWYGAGALQAKLDQRHEAERIGAATETPASATVARK